ncbi:MAG: winged helix DNA-binding domain-containing protein [Chloroflexota bacterium]|nr:winged helix DNA-binding domain-containing protein [Chloroflexota bacterium]
MNPHEIVEHRLHNHHLSGPPLPTPEGVVGWLGAMQAQDYPGAKWSIGARTVGASDAALDGALADGSILRTHMLRPTWHFVLPSDIRWMQHLTAERVHAQMAYYRRSLGLDEALFMTSARLLGAALADGQRLTRPEISALFLGRGIVVDGVRLGHLLMRAELDLVICSGGLKGRQQTYALVDELVPGQDPIPREEALTRLALRYFTSHGPATERDCAWWSGLTVADVRRGIALAGSQLDSTRVADRAYWFAPASFAPAGEPLTAHLLQGFDEYVIAYSQSRDLLDLAGIISSGGNERLRIHVVILGGQVVARWRRVVERRSVVIDARLERPLQEGELRAVNAAVARYARFVEMSANLITVAT